MTDNVFLKKIQRLLDEAPGRNEHSQRIMARIEREMALAREEDRPSQLGALLARAERATGDHAEQTIRAAYKSAARGELKFPFNDEDLTNFLRLDHVQDLIDLHSLASSHNLTPAFTHCNHLAENEATRPLASELLQHIAPIAAKRQPRVLMSYARLLLDHADGTTPLIDPEEGRALLRTAAHRDPRDVAHNLGRILIAEENAMMRAATEGEHAHAHAEAGYVTFLKGLVDEAAETMKTRPPGSDGTVQGRQ